MSVAVAAASVMWASGLTSAAGEGDDRAPGRWRVAKGAESRRKLTDEQQREIDELRSLGYVGAVNVASGSSSVTIHDRDRAYDGASLYTSGHFPGAVLVDMEGSVLHTWRCEYHDAWPGREMPDLAERVEHWRRAYLLENGDVLGIFEGQGIVKINKDSEILWESGNGAHHDLEVADDGRIYVLTREAHIVPRINSSRPILEDFITVLDSDGSELERLSILDAFERSRYDRAPIALGMKNRGDITHVNTLEILDGRLADRIPSFRAGNVLISFRKLHAIAVVDLDAGEIVWMLAGPWIGQHQPTVLANGNILVFDNGGDERTSRVIEFDPVTQEPAWTYGVDPAEEFYTKSCGSNQRLPNGNTLISESDNGRAFEVTLGGEIVWEFWNPERAGKNGELIATLFEMVRLPSDFPLDWLGD